MPNDDFKKLIDEAARRAAEAADAKASAKLEHILAEADNLGDLFRQLKLADAAAYEHLCGVVEAATKKNESIGSVVERLQLLGKVGEELAKRVAGVATGGTLGEVVALLGGLRDRRQTSENE